MTEKEKGFFSRLLQQERWRRVVVGVGLIGMLLIFIGSLFPSSEQRSGGEASIDAQAYLEQTEARLERLLAGVQGVGKTSVLLTLECGTEYRYAVDEKDSRDSTTTYIDGAPQRLEEQLQKEQSYILVDSTGGRAPLVLAEIPPAIQGVVVVCEGAGNAAVASRVIDVVTTSLGITSLQVCVVQSAK